VLGIRGRPVDLFARHIKHLSRRKDFAGVRNFPVKAERAVRGTLKGSLLKFSGTAIKLASVYPSGLAGHAFTPSWNFIVLEIENSFWGTCNSSIDIVANGQRLENFPRTFPRNQYPEKSVLNQSLV
jgi:hypothetical protein